MIKDMLVRQLREKSLSNNLFSDLFWTNELKMRPACCIWTFCSTFHFLYSCSRTAPHILDALGQTASSNAAMSGGCQRAEGWPPSPLYLWVFLYRLLRGRAELRSSSAKVLMGHGWVLPTVTRPGYYRGRRGATAAHSKQAHGSWWNCNGNKLGSW